MGARLDDRLATAAASSNPGAEVERAETKINTLRKEIVRMEPEFRKAMPRGMEATQLIRDAITAVRQVPKLAECEPQTVLGALMTCSQLGLRPHVLGQAWVLPYWSNKTHGYNAQFVLGYPGVVELGFRSEQIRDISFRPVRENEEFEADYGTGDITHKVAKRGTPGEVYGYYALVRYRNEGRSFWYMTVEEAKEYRDRFASSKLKDGTIIGPWRDHFDAMAAKSCLKQLSKFMPKGRELSIAMAADEGVRVDLNPNMSPDEVTTGLDVIDGVVTERKDTTD